MEFSANQIAALAGGVVEGDGEVKLNTIAKIEEGHPGAISFLANPKYTHYIYTTGSSAVLVSKDFVAEQPVSATLIRVDDPYATMAGLSFSDVEGLKPEHVSVDNDGNYWIHKARQKTKNVCSIPYLESARAIAEKYKGHPLCEKRGVLLPVISNQRMNPYLGEIAGICGIKKPLTMHIARHSFACLALANGVSMEIIARMLGHSDIRTTKIYAKVIDKSIAEQMSGLASKFGSQKYPYLRNANHPDR